MRVDDADLRVRLEGRAELLDATRLRYRALVNALKGLGWKDKLRRNREVVREVARVQPEADEAVRHTRRRAAAERWPQETAVMECLRDVEALRAELARLVSERLGEEDEPRALLGAKLLALEESVLFAPRLVLPGKRWALANELLSPSFTPEVAQAHAFGLAVERLFSRPIEASQALPFTLEEWDGLRALWQPGEAALHTALGRLARVDVTGGLLRAVLRKARHLPRAASASAVQQVLHAQFWRTSALARIDEVTSVRLAPASARPHERFGVLRYLLRRERDGRARLTEEGLPPPRAAVLELAHELTGLPAERAATVGGWDALLERATLADQARPEDWEALREGLALMARVMARPEKSLPPLYRSLGAAPPLPPPVDVTSLRALLLALRERTETLPVRTKRK
ncbi:MAG: hypothetical protein AB1938_03750 [Myxococcota bacterium]